MESAKVWRRIAGALAIGGALFWDGIRSDGAEPASGEVRSTRSFDRIDDDIDAALKSMRSAEETIDGGATIESLVRLHREAVRHEKYGRSPTLEKLEIKIRNRLRGYRDELVQEFDLTAPPTAMERASTSLPPSDARARLDAERGRQVADLQALSSSIDAAFLEASLSGGPLGLVAGSLAQSGEGSRELVHFGGGTVRDYGAGLVELITSTINPDSWAINGGHSTIVYYAPLHALVVSAPSEVHEHVGGLLGAMRVAGN